MRQSMNSISGRKWLYAGSCMLGVALLTLGASVLLSKAAGPDHPAKLLEAAGVVPWHTFDDVRYVLHDGKGLLEFGDAVKALNGKQVKLRGYITPLHGGAEQAHFILSSKPPSCPFCLSVGPERMVEVFTKIPLRYTLEPVTVRGVFSVLEQQSSGLMYRLADAGPATANERM